MAKQYAESFNPELHDAAKFNGESNVFAGNSDPNELSREEELELVRLKIDACWQAFVTAPAAKKKSVGFVPSWISRRAKKAIDFFRKLVKGINVRI